MARSWIRGVVAPAFGAVALSLVLVGWSDPQPLPPATASPTLTGEAIYLRAVQAMRTLSRPDFVTFHEDVSARNLALKCGADGMVMTIHHGDAVGAFRVWVRSRDGEAVGFEIPSGQRCDDAVLLEPVSSPDQSGDMFGPKPSPTPAQDLSVTAGGPPIIAAVRAESAHYYRITLVDRESFDGHDVYRLSLRAYRNSLDHPLTGMLVDANSWLVRQATGEIAGHYLLASGYAGGTVTFGEAGPWWVVRDEHLELAANALLVHSHVTLDVHGSDFDFPSTLPDIFPTPRPRASASPR